METATVSVTKSVNLPTTVDEWQLYSTMKGSAGAANRLAAALKKAIAAPTKAVACKIMAAAMHKDRRYGASDSEPRGVAERALSEARGERFYYDL